MDKVEKFPKQVKKEVAHFKGLFKDAILKGMPIPWDGNGDLHPPKRYKEMLAKVRSDDIELACMEASLSRKDIINLF